MSAIPRSFTILGGGGINGTTGLFANGTAAAPSISFLSDTDTGFYRIGANQIGVALGGTSKGFFNVADDNDGIGIQISLTGNPRINIDGSGGLHLIAGGTNQDIALTPSGTGNTTIGAGNIVFATSAKGISLQGGGTVTGSGGAITITPSSANLGLASGSNFVLANGNTGFTTTGTGISLHGGGTITGASGAVTVTASGTNQSITLTPSGTGSILLAASSLGVTNAILAFESAAYQITNTGNSLTFKTNSSTALTLGSDQKFAFANTGTISVGATTSALTDLLINPTTKASGNLFAAQVNSVSKVSIDYAGNTSVSGVLKNGSRTVPQVTNTATAAGTTTLTTTSTLVQIFTGSTTQAVTLPAANLDGAGFGTMFIIKNRSSGTVTINRAGADTIDGATSYAITAGNSVTLISDGISDFTVN